MGNPFKSTDNAISRVPTNGVTVRRGAPCVRETMVPYDEYFNEELLLVSSA